MNITDEMVKLSSDLTVSICNRIDLLKDLLSQYGEDSYILKVALDLITPGHAKYDFDDERFAYDFNSTSGFCAYLMERQKARDKAKAVINAKYGTLNPSEPIYTDTDSFKYAETKENLGSMYGSCQKGVGDNDSV